MTDISRTCLNVPFYIFAAAPKCKDSDGEGEKEKEGAKKKDEKKDKKVKKAKEESSGKGRWHFDHSKVELNLWVLDSDWSETVD